VAVGVEQKVGIGYRILADGVLRDAGVLPLFAEEEGRPRAGGGSGRGGGTLRGGLLGESRDREGSEEANGKQAFRHWKGLLNQRGGEKWAKPLTNVRGSEKAGCEIKNSRPSCRGSREPVKLFDTAGLALHGQAVDFEPGDIGPAAVAVAAAGHQIHEADFIDLAEVDIGDPAATADAGEVDH